MRLQPASSRSRQWLSGPIKGDVQQRIVTHLADHGDES